MAAFRIIPNSGAIPRLDARNLPEGAAQEAANVFLTAGRLESMSRPKVESLYDREKVSTVYRMFTDLESYWLTWPEQVDIAESPVYVENNFRIAFTSPDFEPRQTDLTLTSVGASAGIYPKAWYVLGVSPPINKPTIVSVTGGTNTVSRVYVYTFVTQWGEESAPSPSSDVYSGNASGSWNLTLPDTAPPNTYNITDIVYSSGQLRLTLNSVFGLRAKEKLIITNADPAVNGTYRVSSVDTVNKYAYITMPSPGTITDVTATATREAPHNTSLMTKRVYRSVTAGEETQYFLVGDKIPVAVTTFSDTATIIGEPLASIGWAMPPANLEGAVVHPSGAMVGFVGNQIFISEPYSNYAWPLSYVLLLDFSAVAISISGQSVVVGTTGTPYIITFSDPISATPQKLDQNWPCLSKQGMVAFSEGVYYPTILGLVYIGASGANLVTKSMYAQRDWEKVNPRTFKGGYYDGSYYAVYDVENTQRIIIISETYGVVQINTPADAIYTDRQTGEVYVARDKRISQLNASAEGALEYTWTSKIYILPEPLNLGAAKLDFDSAIDGATLALLNALNLEIIASNNLIIAGTNLEGTVGFDELTKLAVADYVLTDLFDVTLANYCAFTLVVDGVPVYETIVLDNKAFRLPSGFKYDNFSVRLSGTARVTAAVIASTSMALKTI